MTKKTYKPWTTAENAELILMREAKTPTKEIAKALKRSPSSVINRINTQSIPYGKELTFREVVDTAFAKGEIEFGDVDTERKKQSKELFSLRNVLEDMERDIKPSKWFSKLRKFLKKLFGLK